MSTKTRRRWTAEEKLRIIQEARQTEHSVSEVCRHHGLSVGQFYAWEKRARQGSMEGLRNRRKGHKKGGRAAQLEVELQRLRAVIAELSAQNLELKRGRWP